MKSSFVLNSSLGGLFIKLPTPSNITYMWNFGSLLGLVLLIQIVTGLFLSMHYSVTSSFDSVIHIMRDISGGSLTRSIHTNGASLFFLFCYLHISRGILFKSYKKFITWLIGISLLLCLMATAFLGYVLPWGQMSFWGATVITNLVSTIPYVGVSLVEWLWGGFSVTMVTLNRFFSFHFLLPFLILSLVLIHLSSLHSTGSSNPLGFSSDLDSKAFHPFFSIKDLLAPSLLFLVFLFICILAPNIFGDPENFNMADPMSTPIHIQPEWYFLFAYAILRSVPSKLGGVICLMMSVICFLLLPLMKVYSSSKFLLSSKLFFWLFSSVFVVLTWIGANVVEFPYDLIGVVFSVSYFILLIFLYFLLMSILKMDLSL